MSKNEQDPSIRYGKEVHQSLERLVADLFREDVLGAVLRVHIQVESMLEAIILKIAPAPAQLPKRMNFDFKVQLALLLGLDDDFAKPLRALGKIRNEFAHRPDAGLSKESMRLLRQSVLGMDEAVMRQSFENIKGMTSTTAGIERMEDLEEWDYFRLFAITLWAKLQAELLQSPLGPARSSSS